MGTASGVMLPNWEASPMLEFAREPFGRTVRVALGAIGIWELYLAVGPSGLFLGPRVLLAVSSVALLAVVWKRSGYAVELRTPGLRISTWRPPTFVKWIPIEMVAGFMALPWRGGTLGVRLTDGTTIRISVQRTALDVVTGQDRIKPALLRLNSRLEMMRGRPGRALPPDAPV